MDIKIISKSDFIVNNWSGGKTTELFIYPKGASLSKRDFICRISSATFSSTSSVFSDFSTYSRYLLALNGSLSVSHDNIYDRDLSAYEVEYFSGSWSTSSTNTLDCRDFNFIVKDGYESNLKILDKDKEYIPKRNGKLILFSTSSYTLKTFSRIKKDVDIGSENIVLLSEENVFYKLSIDNNNSPVIVCEIIF